MVGVSLANVSVKHVHQAGEHLVRKITVMLITNMAILVMVIAMLLFVLVQKYNLMGHCTADY